MNTAALAPSVAAMILFGIFFTLMFLRVPVAFALGLACVPIFVIEDRFDLQNLIKETFNAYNSFILLAVPFFLLTANLMNVSASPTAWCVFRAPWWATFRVVWRR